MRFRLLAPVVLAALGCSLAPPAQAQDLSLPPPSLKPPASPAADLPPPGARLTHVVAGGAVTLTSYGLAVGSSYLFSDTRGAKDLRIPIAGPWMALAQTGCPSGDPDCSVVPLVLGAIFQVVDGVTQIGGLAIIGEGLFLNTSSSRPAPRNANGPSLRAVPMDFGPGSAGLGFVGTF
ncbi:MAG TPA: hypothetical protein VJN18_01020 [Polyangiaceae bacterium]|nr:hypothetical protein [Polyangiaceae bacterium]